MTKLPYDTTARHNVQPSVGINEVFQCTAVGVALGCECASHAQIPFHLYALAELAVHHAHHAYSL